MHCLISDFSAIKAPFYTESTLKWLWEGRSKQLFGCLQCPFKHVAKRSDGNHSSELCSDMLLTVFEKKRGISKFVRNNKMQPFIILYAVFESCIDTHRAVCICTVCHVGYYMEPPFKLQEVRGRNKITSTNLFRNCIWLPHDIKWWLSCELEHSTKVCSVPLRFKGSSTES